MDNCNPLRPMVRRKNPSFSSSLLDEIYRSFDSQTASAGTGATEEDQHKTEFRHGRGKKMDHDVDMMLLNKLAGRKKSASTADQYHFPQSFRLNSCSTSSDSSLWTSSESETSKSSGQSKLAVKTSFPSRHHRQEEDGRFYVAQRKLKNECGGSVKAESKALKMYSDLKKPKANQPISPGSRFSSFLNSLFTSTGNAKKVKINERKYTSVNASSACSSASSFTRSCFSKTPSSRGKTSVIKDEDRKYKDNGRHNHDNIAARNSTCGKDQMRENNRRAREILKNYERKLDECKMMNDDEDSESCASSDLFELDNLDFVVASRQKYSEELPVYETTSLDANRVVAHRFTYANH